MSIEHLDYARVEVQVFADFPRRHAELTKMLRPLTQAEILERAEISEHLFALMYMHDNGCYKIDPPIVGLGEALCNCLFGQFKLADTGDVKPWCHRCQEKHSLSAPCIPVPHMEHR